MSKQKEILEFVQDVVVLKFQKVHTEDAGEYCLVASNDVGSDTCKVLIDVIGKKMSNAFVTHDSHPEYLTLINTGLKMLKAARGGASEAPP